MKTLLKMVFALVLVSVLVLAGCGTPTTSTPASPTTTTAPGGQTSKAPTGPVYGGTLRIIDGMGSPTFPFGYPPEAGRPTDASQFVLQTLIKQMEDGSLKPQLAESWDVNTNPGATSITFHIRKGIKFHDGTDFNAKAVKWNLEKLVEAGMNKSSTADFKSFDVLDDYTLRINLSGWSSPMLPSFSTGLLLCVSPTSVEQKGVDWARWQMVGTGPFKQVEFKRDVSMTLVKNDNYWEAKKPYLDKIEVYYVADELTQLALLKSGGAEMMRVSKGRTANELKDAGFDVLSTLGFGATALIPDSAHADSPWSKINVRQAAEYAIDKDKIVQAFGYGYWQPAYQLDRPGSIGYAPSITARKYDQAKAKQMLVEAGYPNGFKTKIICSAAGNRDIPVAIQSDLAQVGIQVDLEFADSTGWAQYLLGNYQNALILYDLAWWADPNVGFRYHFSEPPTFHKNTSHPAGWLDMLKASLATPEAKPELTQKLDKAAFDYAIVIPLYRAAFIMATSKKLHDVGYGTRDFFWWNSQDAWLSP